MIPIYTSIKKRAFNWFQEATLAPAYFAHLPLSIFSTTPQLHYFFSVVAPQLVKTPKPYHQAVLRSLNNQFYTGLDGALWLKRVAKIYCAPFVGGRQTTTA